MIEKAKKNIKRLDISINVVCDFFTSFPVVFFSILIITVKSTIITIV